MRIESNQVSVRGPRSNTNGRIKDLPRATQALAGSNEVNDAGALAPVVFSGQPEIETSKIRRINGKGGPYPPKSMAASSMVPLVSTESSCTSRFEEDSLKHPK